MLDLFGSYWDSKPRQQAITVDSSSVALLAVMAAALLLGRIDSISFAGVEARLGRRTAEAVHATVEADPDAANVVLPPEEVKDSIADPEGVIVVARDEITEAFRAAAVRRQLPGAATMPASEAVRKLQSAGFLDDARAAAATKAIRAIQTADARRGRVPGTDALELRRLSYYLVELASGL